MSCGFMIFSCTAFATEANKEFMSVITKELCEQRLREYLDAEEALITGAQSYTVNGRACTKADLGKIQAGIKLWNDRLAGCESNGGKAFRGVRVRGIVPHG